jgi:hypothetical protein
MPRFTAGTIASLTLALVSGLCLATRPARAAGPEPPPASVDLAGRWIYNAELSDDAREKMRQGMGGQVGSRLVVNVKLEGGLGPPVTLKRIYDRAKESQPR